MQDLNAGSNSKDGKRNQKCCNKKSTCSSRSRICSSLDLRDFISLFKKTNEDLKWSLNTQNFLTLKNRKKGKTMVPLSLYNRPYFVGLFKN